MPQRNLLLLLAAVALAWLCYAQGRQDPFRRFVSEGLAAIEDNSLDPISSGELYSGALEGMVNVLRQHGDQHSQFLDRAAADRLRNEIHQRVAGIGIRIGVQGEPPQLMVAGPIEPMSPAGSAKLAPGDRLLQIDDRRTTGMSRHEATAMLKGERGTFLRLLLQSKGSASPRSIELVREYIPTESVLGDRRGPDGRWSYQLANEPHIGYFRITAFGDRTAADFEQALRNSIANGTKAIVIDLRNNTGGSLGAAVAICEMLLPAGESIVETRGRDDTLYQHYETNADGEFCQLPIAVVVNQSTASAAEIVAACLQDHTRAVVVGQRTFGKGTVQQLLPLESGKSLLKLTWAGFQRPSGANIHRKMDAAELEVWGVLPDAGYECKLSAEEFADWQDFRNERDELDLQRATSGADAAEANATRDKQLALATRYLRAKLAGSQ
jgi:carboxyl-terminal processing protease